MFSSSPVRLPLPAPPGELDLVLGELPAHAAVFLLEVGQGQRPYLSRTANLRRRAQRLLRHREEPGRLLNLRGVATEIVFWPVWSSLEGAVVLLEQARSRFPSRYRRMLRLRPPSYVCVLRENRFPRCIVSPHPGPPDATFGPFLYRAHAEDFLSRTLDVFQLRRCDEELDPHPSHPGCIYGEMEMCLRPCQSACTGAAYRQEAAAFVEFLATEGESLRAQLETKRSQASENLHFEDAAKIHKRLQKVDLCWKPRNDFARMIGDLYAAAITRSSEADCVHVWPMLRGQLFPPIHFRVEGLSSSSLAAAWAGITSREMATTPEIREELLSILTRWKHSSWCDGEWVRFDSPATMPFRKILNAAKRMAASAKPVSPMPGGSQILQTGDQDGSKSLSSNDG